MPKRFYANAAISDDGLGVTLDARALRTPGGHVFAAPTRALAEAVAAEWARQGERVVPATMPLTQLAFAAQDHTPARRAELVAHIAKYAETDLCSHRAEAPADLAARQADAWDPLIAWADATLGLRLPVVPGIIAAYVDTRPLRAHAEALGDFRLAALAHGTELAGSVLIALALLRGRLDAAQAYSAATIDEHWSFERWGEDTEARAKLDRLRANLDAVGRFIAALG